MRRLRSYPPIEERFWAKVDKQPDGCWLWQGAITDRGYGCFRNREGKYRGAHRFSYEEHVGPIPDGLVLDHLCRVRNCVNPDHLEPVTAKTNSQRGLGGRNNAVKTHCPAGHPYTPENTYIAIPKKTGLPLRRCKTCHNARYYRLRDAS